jgi:hypothetical protein
MGFMLSPGVEVKEIDLTNVIPAVATSIGATAGAFQWGPVDKVITVGSEKELVSWFGEPDNDTFKYFMPAASFLKYGKTLRVSRAESGHLNATSSTGAGKLIKNNDHYDDVKNLLGGTSISYFNVPVAGGAFTAGTTLWGEGTGASFVPYQGTSFEMTFAAETYSTSEPTQEITLLVTFDDNDTGIPSSIALLNKWGGNPPPHELGANSVATDMTITPKDKVTGSTTFSDPLDGDGDPITGTAGSLVISFESSSTGANAEGYIYQSAADDWVARYPGELGNSLKVSLLTANVTKLTDNGLLDLFDQKPGTSDFADSKGASNDEIHVVVEDEDGAWTGVKGTVLETFEFLSLAPDAKGSDGTNSYYVDRINQSSRYIRFGAHNPELVQAGETAATVGAESTAATRSFIVTSGASPTAGIIGKPLTGGTNDNAPTLGEMKNAINLFSDPEVIDVNLIIGGAESEDNANGEWAKHLIALARSRMDCVSFVSPPISKSVNNPLAVSSLITWANDLPSSSYAVIDSTALYVYDKYSDVYRWIAASGAVAGLCAYTDDVTDPWWSPAGFNRGQLMGVSKLALNPKGFERDELYQNRINPICTFPGEGTVLFGDKTAQKKPSAFDRINVRRLFIVLEKAIATAAKYQLFEFNDEFTRAQFRNMVEPFLRDVKGRRGIYDFLVVCDETNNTGQVIDTNRFIADIYIKPARSINFMTLNFVAVRTGVEFSEIVGKF